MGLKGPQKGATYRNRAKPRTVSASTPATTGGAPDLANPEKPSWLSKAASKLWDKLVPRLQACDHLTSLDEFVLGEYCQITAEMEEIHGKLKGKSYTTNSNKTVSKSSLVTVLNDLRRQQLKLAEQLGLTPKSRKAMSIVVKVQRNDNSQTAAGAKPRREVGHVGGVLPPKPPA